MSLLIELQLLHTHPSNTNEHASHSFKTRMFLCTSLFSEYKIKVTEICPGTIDTQIEKRDCALTAEDLANSILWVSELPSHFNINHIEMNHVLSSKFA